jgi:dephospho-CoA kinase
MVVLDIPLLLEGGGEKDVDIVIVVSASEAVQRARVLERPGMTGEKLGIIRAKQMPDEEKRLRADVVLDTGQGLAVTDEAVGALLERLKGKPGQAWARLSQKP